ncbi:uncharacterized protein [Cicer arietinum]|uniref:uncharacterized protein n=1 Tax=Cicer arietinum TaxID=3827 RepID=UPI003CC6C899
MARRRKLNIRHRASDNEGIQSTSNNTNSTNNLTTKTEEEVASLVPDDRVDPNQYRGLVHHWFSDEGQKISKINRQNRAKFEDVHCMGSKSLPKFIDEKIKKGKGVLPGRKKIYIDTRTRKDGTIVNENVARLIEELKKTVMRLKLLNQPKTHKVLCLGRMTYFIKYKDLIKTDVCDVWARFLILKNRRFVHLKMKSCAKELRIWKTC